MGKIIMDDVDIVNIVQLAVARSQDDPDQNKIIARMSDKAVDWYIHNLVPVVGRPTVKHQFEQIRK